MLKAVGRNVPRKEGRDKVSGASRYIDDLSFPGLLHARTIRSTIPAGAIADIAFPFDTKGFTIVDFNDIPGRNVVALIDERPAVPRRAHDPSRRGAHPDSGARRSRSAAERRRAHRLSRRRRQLRPVGVVCVVSSRSPSTKAISTPASPRPTRSSKASTASARRSSSTSSPTASLPCRPTTGGASRCTDRCSARTTCIAR